jgi:transcriptional regulator with XRE-family HTH domain
MAEAALHIGRKIGRIRELRGMKQEALAAELGISQQAISKIEQSADIDDSALER